ncbi:hypothetical protein [Candidatus Clostridium helianthi]|jgi:hypothetical protein|uniref:Uncharacterized protein n=1 Tax=Candidatus Clostridium helianthi TaxID=3381660 RepID=A0ABW8S1R0_9CLOT
MTEEEIVAKRESRLFCAMMFCCAVELERLKDILNLTEEDMELLIKYKEIKENELKQRFVYLCSNSLTLR